MGTPPPSQTQTHTHTKVETRMGDKIAARQVYTSLPPSPPGDGSRGKTEVEVKYIVGCGYEMLLMGQPNHLTHTRSSLVKK